MIVRALPGICAVFSCAVFEVFGLASAAAQLSQEAVPGARAMRATVVQPLTPATAQAIAAATPRGAASPRQPDAAAQLVNAQPVSLDSSRPSIDRQRRIVPFTAAYPAGAIVIVNRERALYLIGPDGRAWRYPIAIGSFTEEWTGVEFVTDKKVNPNWFPVPVPGVETKEPVLGGDPTNPLGVRALYLGRTLWRIHGTPATDSIGHNVSNGCIRMLNEHVIELYDRVLLGTEVYVVDRLVDPPPMHRGKKVIE